MLQARTGSAARRKPVGDHEVAAHAGLAERTAALGGTIHSSPVLAGGWRLSAELPR